MGILTLLRNALGRSRKGRTAEAEGAEGTKPTVPTQPAPAAAPDPAPAAETPAPAPAQVPEPRPATDDHELVAAAFDNVTVPKQTAPPTAAEPVAEQATETAEREPKPETPEPAAETAEPVIDREPEAETPVAEPESQTPEPEPEPEKPVVVIELEPELEPETPEPVTEREPEPVAKAESEPVIEREPEAVAEAEPEPVTETAEPVAETSEPVTETAKPDAKTAEPVAVAEPDPAVEAETAAEPKAAAEPKPAAEPEPAAADGEEAPQGPPAADNETRTGGAGGNDPAEGEAEAEQTPSPTTTSPATTLTQLKTAAPSLATAYRAATTTLKKNDLTGTRAKVHLVLDRSASMRPYYKDGSAQALAEQTLALAAHLDPEATVHVTFFSTELDGTGELTLTDHENKIDELHAALGRMGRTSYHVAVEEVVTHHQKTTSDDPDAPRTPALVIFQTDGAPDAKTPATQALTDAAKNHPHIHFAFVAFGEHDNKAFDYLRKLKTGNTSFFHAGPTPRELTDTELYTGVLANWKP
ncbi:VWA domain-containing protein [Streptomyces sp. NPDC057798]|uniref:VWA domain-containing protein n=1 Tax=Streptomyces sp. NPDC057798 TaxID=3346252 RepID=UPI0036CFAB5D